MLKPFFMYRLVASSLITRAQRRRQKNGELRSSLSLICQCIVQAWISGMFFDTIKKREKKKERNSGMFFDMIEFLFLFSKKLQSPNCHAINEIKIFMVERLTPQQQLNKIQLIGYLFSSYN